MFVYSTALPVHQPFELVIEKSGVKTRPSEQTMLPVEADLLLGLDSSSETDDQSYSPTEVYALTWHGVLVIHHIFELCYAMLSSLDRHHISEIMSCYPF